MYWWSCGWNVVVRSICFPGDVSKGSGIYKQLSVSYPPNILEIPQKGSVKVMGLDSLQLDPPCFCSLLISQSGGKLQPAVCLFREMELLKTTHKHLCTSVNPQKQTTVKVARKFPTRILD